MCRWVNTVLPLSIMPIMSRLSLMFIAFLCLSLRSCGATVLRLESAGDDTVRLASTQVKEALVTQGWSD